MHLSPEDFNAHIKYVSKILKPDSYYIFTTLNPKYELQKANKPLVEGELYEFSHGEHGEYGIFYHYYKSQEYLKSVVEESFEILKIEPCIPISDKYRESHSRYYGNEPIAYTYVLKAR